FRPHGRPGRAGGHAGRPVRAGAAPATPATADRAFLYPVGRAVLRGRPADGRSVAAGAVPATAPAGTPARAMNAPLEFTQPWALLLLPLALLPVLAARRDALVFSHLPWLPADRTGTALGWASRLLAAFAL